MAMQHKDTVEAVKPNDINTSDDFVEVKITTKDGYSWDAKGESGMVVVTKGDHSEVDIIADIPGVVRLLSTVMIKVSELMHPRYVDMAILIYFKHIKEKGGN